MESVERIFAPLSLQEFVDGYWCRQHLVLHRNDRDYYSRLFRFADVDRYLAVAATAGDAWLSLVKDGKVTSRRRIQETDVRDLYREVNGGTTVLLESTNRCWAPTAELASSLGQALSARVKVNVYMTPPGQQAAPIHPDIQDVLVLQTEGAKEWYLYAERLYQAVETLEHRVNLGYARPAQPESLDLAEQTMLKPGDLLYVPRGMLHRAVAPPDRPSLHLTVCVTPTYWVDFLKVAVEALSLEEEGLAGALPPGFEHDGAVREPARAQFQEMLRRLAERASFDRTADAFARARNRTEVNPADGHFAQLLRLEEIAMDTWVEQRRGRFPRFEVSGETALLSFGAGQVQLPASLSPALDFVCRHPRFRVAELPGSLSEQSKKVLVQRLIREGLLRARL